MRSLGDTLERWAREILNHHRTGASNGPIKVMNLCLKRIKRDSADLIVTERVDTRQRNA